MTGTDAVLAVWRRQLEAMDAGDTEALTACFTPDAHLVHMTGYVQPLDEWMEGIQQGQFVYHQVIEEGAEVSTGQDTAHLVGRVVTGYRPDGSGQAWPLRMDQTYRLVDGSWLCTESRVTLRH